MAIKWRVNRISSPRARCLYSDNVGLVSTGFHTIILFPVRSAFSLNSHLMLKLCQNWLISRSDDVRTRTWSTSVCSSATFAVDDVDADADVCGAPPAAEFDALQPRTSQLMSFPFNQSIDRSLLYHKNIVTQWVQAKLDKLVTSLSQLLINYYRVKMNVQ